MIHNSMVIKSGGGGTPEMVEVNIDGSQSDYDSNVYYVDKDGVINMEYRSAFGTIHFFAQKNVSILIGDSMSKISGTGCIILDRDPYSGYITVKPIDDVVNITLYV